MIDSNNKYTEMQRKYYDDLANPWDASGARDPSFERRNFHNQNSWEGYDYLFSEFDFFLKDKVMLDFGCGPGRNIVLYGSRFERIDGADISSVFVENAQAWAKRNNVWYEESNAYHTNGIELNGVPSDTYDMVMSTICLQHIAVHEIRYNLFKEFYRVLKNDGWITIQMGMNTHGDSPASMVTYYENDYNAAGTNGNRDVEITDINNLKDDLEKIGYSNFAYNTLPGGQIGHKMAVFFRAQKCS